MPAPPSIRRFAATLLVLLASGCGDEPPRVPADPSAPPAIVVSVEPLAMLLRELAVPQGRIHTLLPAGASPHFFAPRPSDLRAVATADWVLRIGGPFDGWADSLLAQSGRGARETVVLALPGLDPLPLVAHHGHHGEDASALDPHCWLDPIRVRDVVVPALTEELAALHPGGARRYREEGERFRRELDALDRELRRLFAPPAPAFHSLHAAWGYLAGRYQLRALGVVEVVPGEAPSPRRLGALIRGGRDDVGGPLLVEPSHHSPAAAVVAEALGAELRLVDPLGDPQDASRADYASLMRFNARAIASTGGGGARTGD